MKFFSNSKNEREENKWKFWKLCTKNFVQFQKSNFKKTIQKINIQVKLFTVCTTQLCMIKLSSMKFSNTYIEKKKDQTWLKPQILCFQNKVKCAHVTTHSPTSSQLATNRTSKDVWMIANDRKSDFTLVQYHNDAIVYRVYNNRFYRGKSRKFRSEMTHWIRAKFSALFHNAKF